MADSNVIDFELAKALRLPPRRQIEGYAADGVIHFELPSAVAFLEFTPEQAQRFVDHLPTLIATARAQQLEAGK